MTKDVQDDKDKQNKMIDEASKESFPASDPPAFTKSTARPVCPDKDKKRKSR